jgi:hypothetical protein
MFWSILCAPRELRDSSSDTMVFCAGRVNQDHRHPPTTAVLSQSLHSSRYVGVLRRHMVP